MKNRHKWGLSLNVGGRARAHWHRAAAEGSPKEKGEKTLTHHESGNTFPNELGVRIKKEREAWNFNKKIGRERGIARMGRKRKEARKME